ncbi:MAG: phenylalanyl-tRNA synthetase beta subunit [Francisellaceae bacterium]|nr:phenylalanyl-tRNA synthetase beta subunit [Francisellaceae bacterium]
MKFSVSWLAEWLSLPKDDLFFLEVLTNVGLEVDKCEEKEGETLVTLKLPANRGDCLSLEGIARELSIFKKVDYTPPFIEYINPHFDTLIPIEIKEPKSCPRYTARILSGIDNTQATPRWISKRLEESGLNSISLIVDITNYVMLELGQPLHAFDKSKINQSIKVRFAEGKESLVLLDDKEIALSDQDLIIADEKGPLALAGLMGGKESGVTLNTTEILLESAHFDAITIRKAVNRHRIHTDASHRFERGVDFELPIRALERATQLFVKYAKAKVGPVTKIQNDAYFEKVKTIALRSQRIKMVLGIELSEEELENAFRRFNLNPKVYELGFMCTIPSYRVDLNEEIDLIEEISRLIGLQTLPSIPPLGLLNFPKVDNTEKNIQNLKLNLKNQGLTEVINYSFIEKEIFLAFNPDNPLLALSNPISEEMAVMRASLLPGLVKNLQYNESRQNNRHKIFEMGNVFVLATPPQEILTLAAAGFGLFEPNHWSLKAQAFDFYDIKGILENLVKDIINLDEVTYKPTTYSALNPSCSADIFIKDFRIGYVGALHPSLIKKLNMKTPVWVFEFQVNELLNQAKPIQFKEWSRYPFIKRDLSLVLDKDISVIDLKNEIKQLACDLLKSIEVFDVYIGDKLPINQKSIALSFIFQTPDRTLQDEEVNKIFATFIQRLTTVFKASLRA